MPEWQREIVFTRIAFLELKDEQRLAKEGYDLLDEKRILLATRIRAELTRLRELRATARRGEGAARAALAAAVTRHGLDELVLYPPLSLANDTLQIGRSRLLGLELLAARLAQAPPTWSGPAVNASPEAHAAALAFRGLLATLLELAASELNLRRLVREYTRTERRARAIENVLLPEIEAVLKLVEEELESLDQEELLRRRRPPRALEREHRPGAPAPERGPP